MPRKQPVQKLKLPEFDPYKTFTDAQLQQMVNDPRPCGVLSIVHGTTPRRIKEVRRDYVIRMKRQRKLSEGTFR